MSSSEESSKNFTMVDVATTILKWRKAVSVIIIASIILGILIALLMPKWYFSYGSVKTTSAQRSNLSSVLGSISSIEQLLGGFTDLGFAAGSSELQTFVRILQSRRVLTEVIGKFKLTDEYNVKLIDEAIDELLANTRFKPDLESNILSIGVYDRDPQRAKEIADYFIDLLNKVNIELNVTKAKSTREFIEARYHEIQLDLHSNEDSLKSFQQKYGVYLLEEQAKSAIESAAKLKGELMLKEIQVGVLKSQMLGDQPEIVRLKDEVNELNKKLTELYYGMEKPSSTGKETRLFVPFSNAPSVGLGYLRLYREVKIKEKLLEVLVPLFEKAKIEEKQDTPTLLVLDSPFIPEKKAKPFRTIVVLIAFIIGTFLSLFCVLLLEYTESMKNHRSEQYDKLQDLVNQIRLDIKHLRFIKFKKTS